MPTERVVVRTIQRAVAVALEPHDRVILAVSGGVDSMVLLDAAFMGRGHGGGRRRLADFPSAPWPAASENRTPPVPTPGPALVVATFDHATGDFARRAVRLVERRASEFGLGFVSARAEKKARTEGEWREQRWEFLRRVARERDAVIATAHNVNDQIETVFIRILRGSGARGLAGLFADSDVVRPLVPFRRAEIGDYASAQALEYVADPSNTSRAHLRNRVRHDLLPAIESVRPMFGVDLLRLSTRAIQWRRWVVAAVNALPVTEHADGSVYVAQKALQDYGPDELKVLWPEIASWAGLTLDRRGTERVAAFTIEGSTGQSIQLSGGGEVVRTREHLVVRKTSR